MLVLGDVRESEAFARRGLMVFVVLGSGLFARALLLEEQYAQGVEPEGFGDLGDGAGVGGHLSRVQGYLHDGRGEAAGLALLEDSLEGLRHAGEELMVVALAVLETIDEAADQSYGEVLAEQPVFGQQLPDALDEARLGDLDVGKVSDSVLAVDTGIVATVLLLAFQLVRVIGASLDGLLAVDVDEDRRIGDEAS